MTVSVRSLTIVAAIIAVLTLRTASTSTANLSYWLLAGFALFGRAQAIQALALSWLFTMLSPGIGAEATGGAVGRYVVLTAAAMSVFFRGRPIVEPVIFYVLLFGLFATVHSALFSPMIDVSLLKAVSWTVALTTILVAWSRLCVIQRQVLERQIFGGLILLMLVSLPLLASSLGYIRNGSGFQGVLNHPQVFGSTMALLGAWAAGQAFGGERSRILGYWALFVVCLILVVLSEARTAGLSMVLGIVIAVFVVMPLSGRSMKAVMPNLSSWRMPVIGYVLLLSTMVGGQQLADQFSGFVTKSGRADVSSLADAYELSRGELARVMWENIKHDPFIGIGFGIASYPFLMIVERDSLLGLPISASIEKGILPLAVWEELGLLGLGLVVGWVILLLRRGAKAGVAPLAVGVTALLLNLGESTFFSPGGMGLLSLILFGWILFGGRDREAIKR